MGFELFDRLIWAIGHRDSSWMTVQNWRGWKMRELFDECIFKIEDSW